MRIFFYVLITALTACLTSQLFKICLNAVIDKEKTSFKGLFQDGSFPSSHSAYITSISVISWINALENRGTEHFEIYLWVAVLATVYATIVIRDALGVRYTVQRLCDAMLLMIEDTPKSKRKKMFEIAVSIRKKSGHEPHEVVGGVIWGVLIALLISSIYCGYTVHSRCLIASIIVYIIISSLYINYRRKGKK